MPALPNPLPLQVPASSDSRKIVLERFWRMFRHFTTSEEGRKAKLLFGALLLLLVIINGLNVLNSYVGRNFMTAIEQRQSATFTQQAGLMLGVFALATIAAVFARYTEDRLGLHWRHWLTRQAVLQYMGGRVYQFIEESDSVPHPDQRISEDIRALTISALSFILMLINSLFAVIAFSGVLWTISPPLFLTSIAYATLGSLLTIWLGRPLVKLNSHQLDLEADFRTQLLHVRENADQIALLRQEECLRTSLLQRLERLTANLLRVLLVNRRLGFATNGYNYLIQIIPALLVAPFFIRGEAEFGIIAQSALAFTILVNAFSLIVSQFSSLSNFAAVLARLSALSEAIEQAQHNPISSLQVIEDPHQIAFENVTLRPGDDSSPLIQNLSIVIPQGTCVLIHATSKRTLTALFKVTAGIGDHSQGLLRRPSLDELQFVPEKPYLAPGTLRQNLVCHPSDAPGDPATIQKSLTAIGLGHALTAAGGPDTFHEHWDPIFSVGEQKLLIIARVLLRAPRFAFLDRIHSSLSDEQCDVVLELLCQSPITFVHLGQLAERIDCYQAILELHQDGTWNWQIKSNPAPACAPPSE